MPQMANPTAAPPTKAAPRTAVQPVRRARPARVLLVEDDPVIAEVFEQALRQWGASVRVARDGQQALHALRDHPPDLLVLDLGLPALPGSEVLRRLRGSSPELPVVVVSGSPPRLANIDAELLRPGRWVQKPVRPRDLVATVRELLQDPRVGTG